jgi:hypothetical protein
MIGLALLLSAAAPQTAIDADRAFAAMAQTEGQWTSFRAFAAPDGTMFVPEAVNAHSFLEGKANPLVAVMWWPAESYLSCDGQVAVNTGPWVRDGGRSVGYFTTIWVKQPDGSWKWVLDHGDVLPRPRSAGEEPKRRRASCAEAPDVFMLSSPDMSGPQGDGGSPDRSLKWFWSVQEPRKDRSLSIFLWDGEDYDLVIVDRILASP